MVEANATAIESMANIGIPFFIQLFATLIGAFVGFGLVILWDRSHGFEQCARVVRDRKIT